MITEAIFNVFLFLVGFLLDVIPDIPGFPGALISSMDFFRDSVVGVIGLISFLYTPVVTIFVFTAILVLLNFDNIYKLVGWFWHKVRG